MNSKPRRNAIEFAVKKTIIKRRREIVQLKAVKDRRKALAKKEKQKKVSAWLRDFRQSHPSANIHSLSPLIKIWTTPEMRADALAKIQALKLFKPHYPFISEKELIEWLDRLPTE